MYSNEFKSRKSIKAAKMYKSQNIAVISDHERTYQETNSLSCVLKFFWWWPNML